MNAKDIKTKEHLIMVLAEANDFCNPVGIIGVTPLEISIERWLNELAHEGLLDIASTDPPLVKLNQEGRHHAFRLSLGCLPEFDDQQFTDVIIALCKLRRTAVQRAIGKTLMKAPLNGSELPS